MDIGLAFLPLFIETLSLAQWRVYIYIYHCKPKVYNLSMLHVFSHLCLLTGLFSSKHLPQSDQNQDEGSHETLREFSLSTILAVTLQCLLLWHDRNVTKSLNLENCLSCQKVRRFNLKKLSSIPTTWWLTSQEKIVH